MAIAFDAATDGGNAASILTFAHTCTGSNRILLVMVATNAGTTPSAVTYALAAMTLIATDASGSRNQHLYYLIAPATGANNVVITTATQGPFGGAVSYTGAAQAGQPDASSDTNSASATTLTGTVTVVADQSWLVCLGQCDSGGANISGGTGTTERARFGGFNQFSMLDSAGALSPGSRSLVINSNTSAAAMQIIVASIAPLQPPPIPDRLVFQRQAAKRASFS